MDVSKGVSIGTLVRWARGEGKLLPQKLSHMATEGRVFFTGDIGKSDETPLSRMVPNSSFLYFPRSS